MSQYTFPANNVVMASNGSPVIDFTAINVTGGTFKGDTDGSNMDGSAHGQTELDQIGSTILSGTGLVGATTNGAAVANQEAGNYIMKAVSGNLATATSTVMATAAAEHGIARNPVHDRNAVRTFGVAAAIRSGNWDIFAGAFSPVPFDRNDQDAFLQTNPSNADDETVVGSTYGIPGELAYRDGSALPISGGYTPKTA